MTFSANLYILPPPKSPHLLANNQAGLIQTGLMLKRG
jgi:hypothetical protein